MKWLSDITIADLANKQFKILRTLELPKLYKYSYIIFRPNNKSNPVWYSFLDVAKIVWSSKHALDCC
jgi:hypothetical protein